LDVFILHHTFSLEKVLYIVKDGMAELYTRDLRERETLENFVLSERAREGCYLCSETATYIGCGKEIKGNNTEDWRKQMRKKMYIWLIGRAMTWEKR